MVTKEDLRKYPARANMRTVEFHLQKVKKHLEKQRSHKAQELAENVAWCLYCLQVQFPQCFTEPAPDFLEMPLFEEAERKNDEARRAGK